MKVALMSAYAWDRFGGVQSHVRGLARALRRRGHDVVVLAPVSGHSDDANRDVRIVGRAVPVPANGSVARVCLDPRAPARARDVIGELEPDVLHLHEPLVPSVALVALLNPRVPTVGTFHAAADSSLAYAAARRLLSRVVERLDVRTAVSDAARALVSRYFPGDYLPTPNGVDVARFANADPMELGDGRTVLFVGRLERRKGLDVLIQAMTRLRGVEARLVVAGDGPRRRSSVSLARALMVDAEFIGRVDDEVLPRLYRSADVCCFPAVGGESFGIVLLEAMAAGSPVVCSDLAGFRSVAGEAALLVPPRDPGLLADALRTVLTDDQAATRVRRDARRVAATFDWNVLAGRVEEIYELASSRRFSSTQRSMTRASSPVAK